MHYYSSGMAAPTSYAPQQASDQFASFTKIEQAIIQQRALLDGYANGPKIGLLLDEWGVWDRIPKEDEQRYGRLWQQSTMRSAVAAGLGLNVFNRQCEKLYMCNIAQIANVLQSLLLTDGPEGLHCVRTTTYHAFALFKPHRSNTAVRAEVDGSADSGISVSASKSGNTLVITLVNSRLDADATVNCALKGVRATGGSAQILHDADLNAANTFDNPDRIVPKSVQVNVEAQRIRVNLPRLSIATVTLQTGS
jgi:alpha-N-arabinofuranosidase